jgi:glutaredoxin
MRKLLVLIVVCGGIYHFYGADIFGSKEVAFDESGNPLTLLFTVSECGAPCGDAVSLLNKRHIKFDQVVVDQGDEQYQRLEDHGGGRVFPILVTGDKKITGFNRMQMISVLSETYGWDVLWPSEAQAIQNHFDNDGNPIVVMYGTQSCGYCRKAEQLFVELGVEFVDLDIERNSNAKSGYDALRGSGTPLIYVGFRRVEGFNKQKIESAIELL